jgi:hypothetical protein
MANNRGITDFPKEIFTDAMPRAIPENQVTVVMGNLSNVNKHFYGMFREDLTQRASRILYQAFIDDYRDTVKRILDSRPDLLLIEPRSNLVIESKLTWQKFYAEKPAIMAAKRKQIEMLTLMLPYYDNLPQTDDVKQAKAEAMSAWVGYQVQENTLGEDEIVIPFEYANYAESLIDVFSEETFPNGSNEYGYGMLSNETEFALSTLFNRLLPEQAVKLDDYPDVELLLLAIYRAYWDRFNTFKNWDQREAFCNRVRGLIQSVLTPETGKIFCEGLDEVVTALKKGRGIELSKLALDHKMKDRRSFYRASYDSTRGAGFNFYCGIFGVPSGVPREWARPGLAWRARFGILMSNKNIKHGKLITQRRQNPKTGSCMIV